MVLRKKGNPQVLEKTMTTTGLRNTMTMDLKKVLGLRNTMIIQDQEKIMTTMALKNTMTMDLKKEQTVPT